MIKVVIVDDQTLVRQGIAGLLAFQKNIELIGEAADGITALALLEHQKPDVLLLDIRMPKMSGIELLQALKLKNQLIPTLLLTTFDDDDALFAGLNAGAKGFLLKDVSIECLSTAIELIAQGKTYFSPVLKQYTLAKFTPTTDHHETPAIQLTPRECEILRVLAGGYNNKEIARMLGTAEGTIKNQVSSILTKLGVRDRVRAVLRGIDLGYITM
jgi:DNA-binding NarL/FixJ family response regulator